MAQVSIQELRVATGSAFNTSFTNAATAAWTTSNGSVFKLRVTAVGKDGLTEGGIADATLQTRLRGAPPPFRGLRSGALKVTTYLGGGTTSATADKYATLAGAVMGTVASPTSQKWFYVGDGSNTTNIVCNAAADCGLANGMGVLIGGEARVAVNVAPTYLVLNMALSSAPAAASNATAAHSVYFDESGTQQYIDWLAIGKSTADQRQGIGCQSPLKFSGLAPGEAPQMELELQCGDWQWCPADGRATMDHTTPSGSDPPTGYAYGGFYIADAGQQVTRATMRAAQFSIDSGISWGALSDPNKPNGVGGWLRNPSRPTLEFVCAYDEDMLGLRDDFYNGTAKQILIQLGTTAGKAVWFYFPKFYLDAAPVEATLGNEAGLKIVGHGDDNYQSTSELCSSAMSLHLG